MKGKTSSDSNSFFRIFFFLREKRVAPLSSLSLPSLQTPLPLTLQAMVSRKASAPKRAAATQKLSKKAATATERAKVKAKASKSKSKTNGSLSSSKKAAEPARADASALATTSKGAGVGVADKHSDRGKVLYVG